MTREQQIQQAAEALEIKVISNPWVLFQKGAEWADSHPHWIPVEDELPEENGKTRQSVSVWATDGLTCCEMRYNFDTKKWTDMWGDPFDVTQWMPMPKPPRKEGEKGDEINDNNFQNGNSSQCVKCVWHSVDELPMFDRGENGDMTPFIVDSYYGHIGGVAHSYTRSMWRNHIDTHRNREFMWAYESDLFSANERI